MGRVGVRRRARPCPLPGAFSCPPSAPPQPQPQTIVIYQQGGFSRLWSWLGWAGFFGCVVLLIGGWTTYSEYFDTTGGIEEKFVSGGQMATDKIAIISIEGVIIEGDGFVKRQIDRDRQGQERQGDRRPRRFARRHRHRLRLHLHHLNKLRKEKRRAARRQHGQHRGQRRVLCLDGGRRPEGRDLCRADDHHRLDRRDHSALRPVRASWPGST